MFTPEEIRKIEFSRSTVGGYRTADVDFFLDDVAVTVETLEKERDELKKKLDVLASKIEEYRDEENSIHIALVNAQRLAGQLKKDAQKTADETIAAAEYKRDKLVSDAELQSAEIMESAKKRATDLIVDATDKADAMLNAANASVLSQAETYNKIKEEAKNFRGALLSYYKAHLEQIDKLSELVDAEPKYAAENAVNSLGGNHVLNDNFDIEVQPFDTAEAKAEDEDEPYTPDDDGENTPVEEIPTEEIPAEEASAAGVQEYTADAAETYDDVPIPDEIPAEEYAEEQADGDDETPAENDGANAAHSGGFKVSLDDFADDEDDEFDLSSDSGRLKFGGFDVGYSDDDEEDDEKAGFGFFKRHKK